MATFFGTTQGERGQATRLGHGRLKVTAQSYDGSIVVKLWKNDDGSVDCSIELGAGSKQSGDFLLYSGKVQDLFDDSLNLGR